MEPCRALVQTQSLTGGALDSFNSRGGSSVMINDSFDTKDGPSVIINAPLQKAVLAGASLNVH
jgi:hypothetical protein